MLIIVPWKNILESKFTEQTGSPMKSTIKAFLFSFLSVLLIQCGTPGLKTNSIPLVGKSEIQKQTKHAIKVEEIDQKKVYADIKKFRQIISTKRTLSNADWKLHDSLLKTYIQLKYRPQNNIVSIPAKTKLTIPFKSYCLDSGKAQPHQKEVFQWRKSDNKITYLNEILRLSIQKKHPQETLQNLIWNLENKTLWDNYPEPQKAILKSLDPDAPLKLPSKLKTEIKDKALEKIQAQLPESVKKAINIIEGQYYDYEDFEQSVESLQSDEELPVDQISQAEETNLYTESESNGFSDQEVTFYNPSDNSQSIDLSNYYQKPFRKDVQPLAAYFGLDPLTQLYKDLEKLLFDDMIRLGLGFTPVLGDLIDLYEASTGRDFFNDEWLSQEERFLSGVGILAGSGQAYRYADKILHAPPTYVRDTFKKYRHIKNTDQYKKLEALSQNIHPKKLPNDWRVKVTKPGKDGQGLEYIHPDNEHTRIRVMPGNPNSKHESQRKPYVKVNKDGKSYDKNGAPTENDSEPSHIPLDDFDKKKYPWIKPKKNE